MLRSFQQGPRRWSNLIMVPRPSCFRRENGCPGGKPFGYKRFAQASDAIRFAMEDLPPESSARRVSRSRRAKIRQSTIFAVCTKAPNFLWRVTVHGRDRQDDRSRPASRDGRTEGDRASPVSWRTWRRTKTRCACGKTNWKPTCWRRRRPHWHEAAEKARYLLKLFATTQAAQDPRRQKLIATVLADFKRLADETSTSVSRRWQSSIFANLRNPGPTNNLLPHCGRRR